MKNRRLSRIILGFIAGIILIALWLSFTELGSIIEKIRQVDKSLVVLAAVIYVLAYYIRSLRWNLLLRKSVKIGFIRTWLYSMGGNFINYMIPIRLGELVKAWFVKRNHHLAVSSTLPSIFIDKSFDTLGIFFILLMMPFLAIKLSIPMLILLGLLGMVFVLSITVILFSVGHKSKVISLFEKLTKILPARMRDKAVSFLKLFIEGLNIFEHHWSVLMVSIFLTALGVFLDGFYFYTLFLAFGMQESFAIVLFGYTLINLSYALPQPPAQLGSNEWMMIIIFSVGFGLTKESASAIMLFAHVLTALIMSLLGTIAFGFSGYDVLKAVYKEDTTYE